MRDVIIIGGGAAGLFCANHLPNQLDVLLIEHTQQLGKKLLLSGQGQCNLTHAGDMKDFITHYGAHGKSIRSILYKYSHVALMNFFKERGLTLFERPDGKVFPESLKAQDVLDVLIKGCHKNNVDMMI